jgi:malate dehydrogenase
MGVHSDGSYGVEEGLIYSFPVICEGGNYEIVQGLEISEVSQTLMGKSETELKEERDGVASLLP